MSEQREKAHEHLKNAIQILMAQIDAAANLDEPFLRDEVINHLTDIRTRIEAADGILDEVKEEGSMAQLVWKVRTLL